MSLHKDMLQIGAQAVQASRELLLLKARTKNTILGLMADEVEDRRDAIEKANAEDLAKGREAGLSDAMLDRLALTDSRFNSMVNGLREVAALKDPIGSTISRWLRPNGLEIVKRRVPIGVIGIIYESRPSVTADTAALCIKTSNAIILRGGKEAIHSNAAIAEALNAGGMKKGLPEHAVQLLQTTDRAAVRELVRMEDYLDLVIPRGGEALIRAVTEQARVPVIKHYKGVCHTYVDESADLDQALDIVENAKCQRPGVCNAMETLLVHASVAPAFLPSVAKRLGERGVELRGDQAAREIVPSMSPADEDDWYAEYLDLILAVRVVPSAKAAIEHINHYGSRHSDAVVASNEKVQKAFTQEVDSATVYINASTRFSPTVPSLEWVPKSASAQTRFTRAVQWHWMS